MLVCLIGPNNLVIFGIIRKGISPGASLREGWMTVIVRETIRTLVDSACDVDNRSVFYY